MAHFDQQGILVNNQLRFWKRRSCETQQVATIQEIASRLSNGNQVDIILLDFAKAFDKSASFQTPVQDGTLWRTKQDKLLDQCILGKIDGAHSAQADVLSGVRQRTVLGPLLFLAYINDLPESLRTSDCRLFADDSLLYCTVIYCDNDRLQRDLSSLEEWEKMWQMSFNPSKCTVIRKEEDGLSVVLYITWKVACGG